MHIFISAGEPSGDLHGANLIRALRELDPDIHVSGFGGERMLAQRANLLYPMACHTVMGFSRVLKSIDHYMSLLHRAGRFFQRHKPDALVMIDFPGFHWWLARKARQHGIPVVYFVPPQLWAWAGWRVHKLRRLVDHVICSLPFEQSWFRQHGVRAQYFGHPYFDELARQELDELFISRQEERAGPIVGVLPGSRRHEVAANIPGFRDAIERIHRRRPDARFLTAAFNDEQRALAESMFEGVSAPVEVHVGRTPEIIRLSRCCMSVSGSVSLELLNASVPSVVSYRISWLDVPFVRWVLQTRHVSLVNVLAGKEILPEFVTVDPAGAGIAERILHWLNDPISELQVKDQLRRIRDQIARPGACRSAAQYILTQASGRRTARINTGSRS